MLIPIKCTLVLLSLLRLGASYRNPYRYYNFYYPAPMEKTEIDPERYTSPLPPTVNGTTVLMPYWYETPDYRMEEHPYFRYYHYSFFEEERPYRLSPAYKQLVNWPTHESPYMLGCTCTTVFKRLTTLGTGAVLTRRHVLTTATSTELVLRRRRHFTHMEDVLGIWYDVHTNMYNSSMYATVARITYHPRYLRPELVNRSHPFPVTFDLAVWTMAHYLYGGNFYGSGATYTCQRGSSSSFFSGNVPTPAPNLMVIIVGFQFIKAFRRPASPWVKYGVRTKKHVQPCPLTEWGWYHCISTTWAKYGLDSGANMHRTFQGTSYHYDGLLGMNTLSLKLRSVDMVHYFINLDSHPVLDFLYEAYMGMLPYEWMDTRYRNVMYDTLQVIDPYSVFWHWEFGEEHLYHGSDLPNY